jgi:hypothetical protein
LRIADLLWIDRSAIVTSADNNLQSPGNRQSIRIPQSAIRNPHSAFRIPHSAFRIPQSAIRNPQ